MIIKISLFYQINGEKLSCLINACRWLNNLEVSIWPAIGHAIQTLNSWQFGFTIKIKVLQTKTDQRWIFFYC